MWNPAMNPSKEKQLYDLDKSLWSVTRVLKHCPKYRKQLWALLDEADQAAIREVAAKPVK
jgi:hypothetical protein